VVEEEEEELEEDEEEEEEDDGVLVGVEIAVCMSLSFTESRIGNVLTFCPGLFCEDFPKIFGWCDWRICLLFAVEGWGQLTKRQTFPFFFL
jgi:hypothetical protein